MVGYIKVLSSKGNNAVCRNLVQERTFEVVDQSSIPGHNDSLQEVKAEVLQRLKKLFFLVAFALMIAITYQLATRYSTQVTRVRYMSSDDYKEKALKFQSQRNAISRQLNLLKQAYGQQSCKLLSDRRNRRGSESMIEAKVSENGGWCKDASNPLSNNHLWDPYFSTALSNFLKGKTVGSFGEGPGNYKNHIDSLGQVLLYEAYDGAPYSENVTNGLVKFLDLTASHYGLPAYDWVVSVEVGEHIPAKYEDIYLDNLVRHAIEGIILSWAVPDQDGLGHVNPKHIVDVINQMKLRGFCIDRAAGESLRNAASFLWLRGNIQVYTRLDPKSFHEEDA